MDEETLNNTITVQGREHIGGFVLLERIDDSGWRAEWQGNLHFKAGATQRHRRLFPMPDPEPIIIHCW